MDDRWRVAGRLGRDFPDGALAELEGGAATDDADDAQGFAAGGTLGLSTEGGIGQANPVSADLVEVALDETPAAALGVLEEVLAALAVYGDHAVVGHWFAGERLKALLRVM